jgi:hypothetical protein
MVGKLILPIHPGLLCEIPKDNVGIHCSGVFIALFRGMDRSPPFISYHKSIFTA